MNYEYFETEREYRDKYPSEVYKCYRCKKLTIDPNICTQCGAQANILFGDTYRYKVGDKDVLQIFIPVEKVLKQ